MMKQEEQDFLKSLKRKFKDKNNVSHGKDINDEHAKASDEDSDQEIQSDEDMGDEGPIESKKVFRDYLINVLVSCDLEKKRASKMEILDFLTLLNCMNQAGIHFRGI